MFLCIIIIASAIYLDQLTKWLAVIFLKPIDTMPLIKGVFHFTYAENKGAAFSMFEDKRYVFMTVSIIGIAALCFYLFKFKPKSALARVALSLVIGGGLGNMVDRTFLGYVVDFIDVRLINFAIFNFADSCVCVGAGLLILYMLLDLIKEEKKKRAEATQNETVSSDS